MKSLSPLKVLVLSLAAVAAFTALVAAPASAKRFVTEDGNISCIMRSSFVRCDVTEHKWESPKQPKTCEFDYGSSFYIDPTKAGFACVSDATGATQMYPAGTKFQTGPNVCRLRKNGKVKCVHKEPGAVYGFAIGKKSYDFF